MVNQANPFVTLPIYREPSSVAIAGDWHGSRKMALNQIHRASNEGACAIIQLGDFGLLKWGEVEIYLNSISDLATELKLPIFFIDGNHEDFEWIKSMPLDHKTGLQSLRPNLWRLPRGARWSWGGVNFAAIGGATSLDRPYRKQGVSWWPEEEVSSEQIELLKEHATLYPPVDVLFTHDAPLGISVPGIRHRDISSTSAWGMDELVRAWEHRERLGEVVALLKPLAIFHGHFHRRYSDATGAYGVKTETNGLGDESNARMNIVIRNISSFSTKRENDM